ncbi:MAG TPA: hypothetical protein VIV60_03810, partial [Polyangiaceae bacterium]
MNGDYVVRLALGTASALVFTGLFLIFFGAMTSPSLPGRRLLDSYVAYLERMAQLCFLKQKPRTIVRLQAVGIVIGVVAIAATKAP